MLLLLLLELVIPCVMLLLVGSMLLLLLLVVLLWCVVSLTFSIAAQCLRGCLSVVGSLGVVGVRVGAGVGVRCLGFVVSSLLLLRLGSVLLLLLQLLLLVDLSRPGLWCH